MPAPALALHDIHLTWPDGTPAFAGLDLQIPPGRTGLVGANGTGKTTLLKLLGREVQPQRGAVTAPPTVALLPQDLALRPETRVDAHLGLAERRAAIAAIEAGDTDPALFDLVGDDWNVEDRVIAGL
ncbi:MAG: ATP-binding cassette domain-containing protein, partial [Stenotrophomonas sp.]